MATLVIPQKMSGSGTIHDLASEHYERKIEFPRGHEYAIVYAAYYGGEYTTHATAKDAAEESYRQREFSHAIIGCDGYHYSPWGDTLRKESRAHYELNK